MLHAAESRATISLFDVCAISIGVTRSIGANNLVLDFDSKELRTDAGEIRISGEEQVVVVGGVSGIEFDPYSQSRASMWGLSVAWGPA